MRFFVVTISVGLAQARPNYYIICLLYTLVKGSRMSLYGGSDIMAFIVTGEFCVVACNL